MSNSRTAGLDAFAQPVVYANEHDRAAFLKRTALWTLGGLSIAAVAAVTMAVVVAMVPALLNRWAMMGIIFGSFYVAQSVAGGMVYGGNKVAGFVLGATFQGIALGYVLLMATLVGAQVYGEGIEAFAIIAQAGGLTGLTALSMVAWLWSAPKDLSMVAGALRVLGVPMLVLMVISFVFPIGGVVGLLINLVFVGVSAGGLLYQVNQVLHTMRSDMHVEGAYTITLGLLVLFWNILTLLMRLQSRD